jgi:hypothetical protein
MQLSGLYVVFAGKQTVHRDVKMSFGFVDRETL